MVFLTGFTCSSFDLLHAGHLLMLEECSQNCDNLVVGLHTDPSIDRASKNRPIESVYQRYLRLSVIKFIDRIIPYETEEDLLILLTSLNPDVRFLGEDYIGKDFTGSELTIPIHYCKRYGYSSSSLREKIYERERLKLLTSAASTNQKEQL